MTKAKAVEAFILCDCPWGKCGEVGKIPADQIEEAKRLGVVDIDKAAIAAAKK